VTYPQWRPSTAQSLATFAHEGQVDKAGVDYIGHARRVVYHLIEDPAFAALSHDEQDIAIMVAWLHDVIEDTAVTSFVLSDLGCPGEVRWRVANLSRLPGQSPEAYYDLVARDSITLMVKAADIADNSDPKRLALLSPDTQRGLIRTYTKARKALGLETA
jgi:(p)ppGpp synthase/HD superfamily hydrolase